MTEQTDQSMHIDPYERNWIRVAVVLLVVFVVAITVAGFGLGFHLPSPEERVDPNALDEHPVWSDPGLRVMEPGVYEAYVIANVTTFAWEPREIEVPVGSTVTFHVTSRDVQHGFLIQGTNVNMQVLPGHVSTLTATFDEPGTYPYICTEYCGRGHALMAGSITVVEE